MKHHILCPYCSRFITLESNVTIKSRATYPQALDEIGISLSDVRKWFISPDDPGMITQIKRFRNAFPDLGLKGAKEIIEAARDELVYLIWGEEGQRVE